VDVAVSTSVVQLCLKLTESELKSLLARMAEWRDFNKTKNDDMIEGDNDETDDESWRQYSRGVTYFNLVSLLGSRLKSIFLPSMALIWPSAITALLVLSQKTESFFSASFHTGPTLGLEDKKSSKKRKSLDNGHQTMELKEINERKTLSELILRSQFVLSSVKTSCVYDSEGKRCYYHRVSVEPKYYVPTYI
jgi:hypothetical protein